VCSCFVFREVLGPAKGFRFPFCSLPEFSSVMHGCEGESGGAVATRSAKVRG
jgi:hypothetical protein